MKAAGIGLSTMKLSKNPLLSAPPPPAVTLEVKVEVAAEVVFVYEEKSCDGDDDDEGVMSKLLTLLKLTALAKEEEERL